MRIRSLLLGVPVLFLAAMICAPASLQAEDGKLKVHATPPQAYVFIDGQAMHEASRGAFPLSPGKHSIEIYNYGYKPAKREVSVEAGKTTTLEIALDAVPGEVSGPWGCITIEKAERDAVLLNGKTPDYFVGHGDEFNHEWWWKQELIVPPGTHQLTIMRGSKDIWSGPVKVPANQRVVIDIPKGVRKTVSWHRGEELKSVKRFSAGVASATVAVSKPVVAFAVKPPQIACGDAVQLQWSATDAPVVEISDVGKVASSGERSEKPAGDTTYKLTASGPGGTTVVSAPVAVKSAIDASFTASPAEVKIGDKASGDGVVTLNWSSANSNSVSIGGLGLVASSGSRSVKVVPQKMTPGPVDETVTYVLKATNACGVSVTRTASVRLTGGPPTVSTAALKAALALHSIYFPTNEPLVSDPQGGLVPSQQQILKQLASNFKQYLATNPQAQLLLIGHADQRGSSAYNTALSQRRVDRTMQFLVSEGVPAEALKVQALGKEKNLTSQQVKKLLEKNPDLTAENRDKLLGKLYVITLANNRRVDVSLSTTGEQSVQLYPFNAADYLMLLDEKAPSSVKKQVKKQPKK